MVRLLRLNDAAAARALPLYNRFRNSP